MFLYFLFSTYEYIPTSTTMYFKLCLRNIVAISVKNKADHFWRYSVLRPARLPLTISQHLLIHAAPRTHSSITKYVSAAAAADWRTTTTTWTRGALVVSNFQMSGKHKMNKVFVLFYLPTGFVFSFLLHSISLNLFYLASIVDLFSSLLCCVCANQRFLFVYGSHFSYFDPLCSCSSSAIW